jgi:5-oxopent-3-ene-1,2,5-tricarboxylate decarboxylase/2-hydroxyhepta-2,4-diene-1,7-dioate isomerase
MRFCRFLSEGNIVSGRVEGKHLLGADGKEYEERTITWLPPVSPKKVIGLVLNYSDHADELGMSTQQDPVLFIKPNNTLIGHLDKIVYPTNTKYMHYEAELAVIIGKPARRIAAKDALDYVKGYSIANDVTVRDFITNTFRPPVKAKGFDTFLPLGPYVTTPDQVIDPSNLEIRTLVNGTLKQQGNTRNMIHGVSKLIEYISEFMTLEPEDLILTGTPKGISPIVPGDKVDISIDKLGSLSNEVVLEKLGRDSI